jgi:hypothetical protein
VTRVAVTADGVDETWRAWLRHLDECTGCSAETAPCQDGEQLRQAWKAAQRICCRCQKGINPGEPYERHVHDRPTAAPFITFSHKGACHRR